MTTLATCTTKLLRVHRTSKIFPYLIAVVLLFAGLSNSVAQTNEKYNTVGNVRVSQSRCYVTHSSQSALNLPLQEKLRTSRICTAPPGNVAPDSTLWLHWRVVSASTNDEDYVLRFNKTYAQSIDVWHVRNGKPSTVRSTGMSSGADTRDINSSTPALRINVYALDTVEVIARISGESSKIVAQHPEFLTSQTFHSESRNEQLINGLFFGLVVALLIYNLFVYFSTRERAYLAYVLNTGATAIWMYAFVSLPNVTLPTWIGSHTIQILYITSAFAAALGTWFVTELLKTSTFAPRLHKTMMVFVGLCCLYALTMFVTTKPPYSNISNLLGIIQTVLCTTAGVLGIRKKQREATVFLFAYAVLLASLFYWTAENLGLELHWFDGFTALRIGTAIELLVLSMLLADKLNTMRSAHEEAQRKALEAELYRLRTVELEQANERSDRLLLNILPEEIATRMKAGEQRIADSYDNAVVIFADIVGFTTWSASLGPKETVDYLDIVFSELDKLAEEYGMEKIKTIGDCYMVVAGVPNRQSNPLQTAAKFALQLRELSKKLPPIPDTNNLLSFRIGMDCGAVVAGVIGRSKFTFDLWGNVVNMASRMESHGMPNQIRCTESVYNGLEKTFVFSEPQEIHVKGKGSLVTYLLQHENVKEHHYDLNT